VPLEFQGVWVTLAGAITQVGYNGAIYQIRITTQKEITLHKYNRGKWDKFKSLGEAQHITQEEFINAVSQAGKNPQEEIGGAG